MTSELIKEGYVVWAGDDTAGVIEIIRSDTNEEGKSYFEVKGRTLEVLLTTRIIWGTYTTKNKYPSQIIHDIVDKTCINPTDIKRKIPWLESSVVPSYGQLKNTFQKTGGEVYDVSLDIANEDEIGFSISFDARNSKLIFKTSLGVDRTIDQNINEQVVLSTELNDILQSSYYINIQNEKHIALVLGEGEGVDRKLAWTGDDSLSGFLRKEMFIDARDLQSSYLDADGNTITLTPTEYTQAMVQRGDEKLSEQNIIQTFEVELNVLDSNVHKFGVDYFVGDKITIHDSKLGVIVNANITSAEEILTDKYSLTLVIGYELAINKKLKRLKI